MSDQPPSDQLPSDQPPVSGAVSGKDITVQISYCPALGLYHYKRSDGEYFFDGDQLEQSLEAYLLDGKKMDAEYMAKLTSFARVFPHKLVTFFADKTFEVRDPVVAPLEDDEPAESPADPDPAGG